MKKFMYYFLQWTWGLPMNIIGAIACLIALCCKCPIQKYRNGVEILVNNNFGGLELGMFFIRGKDCPGVCPHEYGHGIQHLWWGPLFPFVIGLPSATRYWIREFKTPQNRRKFVAILMAAVSLVTLIIGVVSIIVGNLFFTLFAIALFCYGFMLCLWLTTREIPNYEQKKTKYDDVWFEGQATKLGTDANNGRWTWL